MVIARATDWSILHCTVLHRIVFSTSPSHLHCRKTNYTRTAVPIHLYRRYDEFGVVRSSVFLSLVTMGGTTHGRAACSARPLAHKESGTAFIIRSEVMMLFGGYRSQADVQA